MIINVGAHLPFPLLEIGQINPLRWNILFKEEDGSFTSQTGVFKCKDYLNDAVAWYNGVKVAVYGMNFNNIKLNEEGVYLHLTGLNYKKALLNNLEIISKEGEANGLPALSFEGEAKNILLFVPREYFRNTYTISFLSYCIRISHCGKLFTAFEDVIANEAYKDVDNPFRKYYSKVMASKFQAPIKASAWTYLGKTMEDKLSNTDLATSMHNAGCYNYFHFYENGI